MQSASALDLKDNYSTVKDHRIENPATGPFTAGGPRGAQRQVAPPSAATCAKFRRDPTPIRPWAPRAPLVELIGIEPTTSGLQSPRSPS